MCLRHFRRTGRFIKVFHQSKKECFFAVKAAKISVFGFSLSTDLREERTKVYFLKFSWMKLSK